MVDLVGTVQIYIDNLNVNTGIMVLISTPGLQHSLEGLNTT